jgi:hypothetical protein
MFRFAAGVSGERNIAFPFAARLAVKGKRVGGAGEGVFGVTPTPFREGESVFRFAATVAGRGKRVGGRVDVSSEM